VLPIIAGPDWRDPSVIPMPLGDATNVDLKALRVAFHTDNGVETPTRETVETVMGAAHALEASVAAVEEARPDGIERTYEIFFGLLMADGGAGMRALLQEARTEQVHPLLKRVLDLQHAHAKTMAEFVALIGAWDAFRQSLLAFLSKFDVIVCPVCSFPGMIHGATYDRLPAFSYTMTYNLTGWPAAVVRAGRTAEGLPIGVQIVARPWREDVALAVAAEIERSLGGYQRPPL
jgi:amidase